MGIFGSDVVRTPDDDPVAALEGIADELDAAGRRCDASHIRAAAAELRALRARALDPVTGQAAVALTVEEEWVRNYCVTCFGWKPECPWARPGEPVGHLPNCARAAIVAASKKVTP